MSARIAKFAIVAMKRTGSNYLVNLVGNHPDIHCCGEIFIPGGVNIRWPQARGGRPAVRELEYGLKAMRETDPENFLARIFALDFAKPVVGFKIFPDHHPAMLGHILADRSIAKIVHFRANVLARYASNLAARKTRDFGKHGDKPPVAFDAKEFAAYHDEQTAFYDGVLRRLAADGQPCHLSRYDEINNEAAMLGVFKFLGVAPEMPPLPEPPSTRGAAETLSRFSNQKEVRAFLRERGLLHWAREGDTLFAPLPAAPLPR